jgi:uncharacterized protein (DUF433 family)
MNSRVKGSPRARSLAVWDADEQEGVWTRMRLRPHPTPVWVVGSPDVAALFRRRPQGYTEMMKLTRITVDPGVCTGKPCIRGLRFPVARLLGLLASGSTRDQILADYPYLQAEDIDEALQYAALLAEDETVELAR